MPPPVALPAAPKLPEIDDSGTGFVILGVNSQLLDWEPAYAIIGQEPVPL